MSPHCGRGASVNWGCLPAVSPEGTTLVPPRCGLACGHVSVPQADGLGWHRAATLWRKREPDGEWQQFDRLSADSRPETFIPLARVSVMAGADSLRPQRVGNGSE